MKSQRKIPPKLAVINLLMVIIGHTVGTKIEGRGTVTISL